MYIVRIVLTILIAGVLGGLYGYSIASNRNNHTIAQLQQERDRSLVRERELRTQLQEALAERAALVTQTQRLQEDLQARLRRLEDTAAALAASVTRKSETQNTETANQEQVQDPPLP